MHGLTSFSYFNKNMPVIRPYLCIPAVLKFYILRYILSNSKDPRFLIGEQVRGAPFVKKSGIEPVPMGYLICEPGGKAGEVGKADLIGYDDHEIVAAYSMAAEFLGFRLLYLEAGSGSQQPVNPELIKTARDSC